MTLEQFTARINANVFWKEFTFSETRFYPRPKQQVELADGIVKIGSLALVFQLKERSAASADPEVERQWFRKKVLRKAVDQIKDTLHYLTESPEIELVNDRGHKTPLRGDEVQDIKKIVVFSAGPHLPEDCWNTRFHISATAGFIHVVAAHDYLGILEKLRIPDDVRLYFDYREEVLPKLKEAGVVVAEPDIMAGFLSEKDLPEPGSSQALASFLQDLGAFDLSYLMHNLQAHIVNPDQSTDYYRILEEFARVPRSVWREYKARLVRCIEASAAGRSQQPYRFAFPRTECTFMIASMDPDWPSTGEDGLRMRSGTVALLTEAAKYDQQTRLCVGLLISKDGEYFQLDWCFIEEPWAPNEKMSNLLAENSLFGPAREKEINSFLFQADPSSAGT